jgi:hypothetical protein
MRAAQQQALRPISRQESPSAMQCTRWRGASTFDTEQAGKWCLTPIVATPIVALFSPYTVMDMVDAAE